MDEEKKIEESANTFLKSFFDATYNDIDEGCRGFLNKICKWFKNLKF